MTTAIEYALMAGHAYRTTRDEINWIPSPEGWTPFFPVPDPTTALVFPVTAGFEAVSFVKGTEIVISFAGTYPTDFLGDQATNAALALGSGSDTQLIQAVEYYLKVKASAPAGTTITLTGHSLGGGLAALVGVFFGIETHTFDQAPFARTAILGAATLLNELASKLDANGNRIYSNAVLEPLANFIQLQQDPLAPSNFIPNAGLVTDINVQGEFLSEAPSTLFDRIGSTEYEFTHNPVDGILSGFDLHAQALLTAFQYSKDTAATGLALNDVTFKLTDLLKMIFDSNLFYNDPSNTDSDAPVNFLEHLVQHQAGVQGTITADAMVTRFTSDLWKLARDGGLTMADGYATNPELHALSNALIAFDMQKYYEENLQSGATPTELFTDLGTSGEGSNGIRFDTADVVGAGNSITGAKGYKYFEEYLKRGEVILDGEIFTPGIFSTAEQGLNNYWGRSPINFMSHIKPNGVNPCLAEQE